MIYFIIYLLIGAFNAGIFWLHYETECNYKGEKPICMLHPYAVLVSIFLILVWPIKIVSLLYSAIKGMSE